MSRGATPGQRRAYHKENLARYVQWCKTHRSTWLVSHQRSGRNWLTQLMAAATGLMFPDPLGIDHSNYEDFGWCCVHGGGVSSIANQVKHIRVIMLIRDPRDVALSSAYRGLLLSGKPPTLRGMTPEKVDYPIQVLANQWHRHMQTYAHLYTYLVQYEQLCLFPERILTELLDLLEIKPIKPVGEVVRQLDMDGVIKVEADTGNLSRWKIPNAVYKDDYSRYLHHCLKWTRDPMFLKRHNDKIWAKLHEPMTTYGYTQTGHDLTKWGILNV